MKLKAVEEREKQKKKTKQRSTKERRGSKGNEDKQTRETSLFNLLVRPSYSDVIIPAMFTLQSMLALAGTFLQLGGKRLIRSRRQCVNSAERRRRSPVTGTRRGIILRGITGGLQDWSILEEPDLEHTQSQLSTAAHRAWLPVLENECPSPYFPNTISGNV